MARTLKDFVDAALERVTEVDPEWVVREVLGSDFMILDVREPEEFAEGHLPGAINVPRGFLEVKADLEHYKRDDRLADRTLRVVCYCGGGHRSALAADTLRQMGFQNPLSIRGGWTLWIEQGHPIET
ncbi:MAG: rhodanese-like domain-containing protein [Fimbriimonadaceae bacterium]